MGWSACNLIWHLRASSSSSERPELSRPQSVKVLEHGFVGVEFEARLVLAEWEKKTGHDSTARIELAALESSAAARGLVSWLGRRRLPAERR